MFDLIAELQDPLGKVMQSIERLAWDDLPWVPMDGEHFHKRLPIGTSAIYFVWSGSRGLLYIGRASNVRQRWGTGGHFKVQHHRRAESLEVGDCRFYWLVTPRHYLGILEALFIHYHRSPWNNHQRPTNKKNQGPAIDLSNLGGGW